MSLLDGKVAIVTGGGRGIGRAIAEALTAAGASVLITAARQGAELAASAAAIGRRVIAEQADVTREEDCRRVVAQAIARLGGLHILVNNAGRGYPSCSRPIALCPKPSGSNSGTRRPTSGASSSTPTSPARS